MIDNCQTFNKSISKDLSAICAPLEKSYGITLVAYRRFYATGGLFYLFNHADWMDYCYSNQCWNSTSFYERVKHLSHKSTLYYIWPDKPDSNDEVYCALYGHNIWNGILIYKKYPDCLETYAFASCLRETSAVKNVYLYDTDVLEHFILYFKDKIFPLVENHERKILLPCSLPFNKGGELDPIKIKFIQDTVIKHFYLRHGGKDIRLTKREEECLGLLARGKKNKEIGKMLNLSPRTVEFYLNNIIHRCHDLSKNQLLQLYQDNRQLDLH